MRSCSYPWAGAIAVALLAVAACGLPTTPPVPSDEEARAYLRSVVERVATDPASICELGSGTCAQTLRGSDPARIPTDPPLVVGSRVLPPQTSGTDVMAVGGRVLELCGRDGVGDPYYSEMLVFHDGTRLISTGTPYWLGITTAETPTTEGPIRTACWVGP
jgi:hypothetical protein